MSTLWGPRTIAIAEHVVNNIETFICGRSSLRVAHFFPLARRKVGCHCVPTHFMPVQGFVWRQERGRLFGTATTREHVPAWRCSLTWGWWLSDHNDPGLVGALAKVGLDSLEAILGEERLTRPLLLPGLAARCLA